jgi:hypothetical protein
LLSQTSSANGCSGILHADADDGVTQSYGFSGARIAQGVVGYAKNVTIFPAININALWVRKLNHEGQYIVTAFSRSEVTLTSAYGSQHSAVSALPTTIYIRTYTRPL